MVNIEEGLKRVPVDYMAEGLRNYFVAGIPPGGFLESLLCNDLCMAVQRADNLNRPRLLEWVYWLYEFPPANSWGSVEKYEAWLARFERSTAIKG
jgi:hypothetical protein